MHASSRIKTPNWWKMRASTMKPMFWTQFSIFKIGWESQWDFYSSLAKGLIICAFRPRLGVAKVNNSLGLFKELRNSPPKATGNDFVSKRMGETFFSIPLEVALHSFRDVTTHLAELAHGRTTPSSSLRQIRPWSDSGSPDTALCPADFPLSQLQSCNWFRCHRLGMLYSKSTRQKIQYHVSYY